LETLKGEKEMTDDAHLNADAQMLSPGRLLTILTRQLERDPQMTLEELIRIAVLQICRPGQIGRHLNQYRRLKLVSDLCSKFKNHKGLSDFKKILHELSRSVLVYAEVHLPKSLSAQAKRHPLQTQKQLKHILKQGGLEGEWAGQGVNEIATKIYKSQKKSRQGMRRLFLDDKDPLRKVWGFEDAKEIDLPRQDVRHQMLDSFKKAKAPSGKSLADILRDASVFRPNVLKSVLADYWSKGQPVGFVDQQKTILLFRVSNSADAQELMFQQLDIIDRLKSIPGFQHIKKVRFEIVS
jgi:hypothetical protein